MGTRVAAEADDESELESTFAGLLLAKRTVFPVKPWQSTFASGFSLRLLIVCS